MKGAGHAEVCAGQHGRPEQSVEIDNVLADEVMHFGGAADIKVFAERITLDVAQRLETGQITHRRIQPHIEKLARRIRDCKAEIRCIARDVPVAQATFGVEPLAELGNHAGMGDRVAMRELADEPFAQQILELANGEKEMLGIAQHRLRTGHHRAWILQVGRCIRRTAVLAIVAVLVRCSTFRAFTTDVAIGQEHLLDRIVQLLD